MKFAIPVLALCLSASGVSLPLAAATHTWPGSAPCNATLQACIDAAANGDYIYIKSNATINETVNLYGRSLTLRAANGYHPQLAAGRSIFMTTSAVAGNITARLSGIRLLNGYVDVRYNGTGTGTYDIRDMDANSIEVEAANGVVDATVYNNRIVGTPSGPNDGVLRLNNRGAELNAEVYFNRVTRSSATNTDGAGILVDETGGASGKVKLLGNVVHGAFNRGGIFVSEGLFSSTTSNFDAYAYSNVVVCDPAASFPGRGIGFTVNDGNITAQAVNNTVSRCYSGVSASNWSGGGGSGASIDGLVSSNLIVGADYGLFLNQPLASDMAANNDYNLINADHYTNGSYALGPNTITAPAQLVSSGIPRLTAASPAIDAGDSATLGFGLIFAGMPGLDADGLRRFKGPGSSAADIGAYEYGDLGFMHNVSATSSSHVSNILNPVTDGDSSLDIFATSNFNAGGAGPAVVNNNTFGSWYWSGHWTLFNEDTSVDMIPNARFNVFVAGKGSGVFRHVATSGNTSGWSTKLDDSSVNDKSDRIVLVNQNYTAGPEYNDHPVGVFYFAFGSNPGSWSIINLDQLASGGDMSVGAGFSVYAQQPSPNAFRVTQDSTSSVLALDHPLLNNTPCAQVAVTRMLGSSPVGGNFDVYYSGGRWKIFSYGGSIEVGDQFNVLVNPRQVELCSDVIFADGFQ